MFACSVLLTISLIFFIFFSYYSLHNESQTRMSALATIISEEMAAAIAFNNELSISRTLDMVQKDSSINQIFILDNNENIQGYYSHNSPENRPDELSKRLSDLRRSQKNQLIRMETIVEHPVRREGVAFGHILIQQSRSFLARKIGISLLIGSMAMLILMAAGYIIADKFQRTITKQIRTLSEAMTKVSRTKDYSMRVPPNNVAELNSLAICFNRMLSEISARDNALLERQNRLNWLANYDELTGLPNRTLFFDRLEQAIHRAARTDEKLAVFFIDLDDFKLVNDTHGHRTGDLLLKETASRLSKLIRAADTIARLGGDEFIIFMQDVKSYENTLMLAKKHLDNLNAPYSIGENRLFISVSIGISIFPEHGMSAEALAKNADTAMYISKEMGKNQIAIFTEELHEKVSERLQMVADIGKALENNSFELYYQPLVNLTTRSWEGVEALIRWNHKTLGMIPPEKLISLSEETGLILQIGEWVINEACRQLKEWHTEGILIPRVSINVSPIQLQQQKLFELLKEAISSNNLDPGSIELEITESALMKNITQAIETMKNLQELGVSISLDDFGTGFSSLSHLRNLPIDRLKTDRSFLLCAHEKNEDREILSAIIAMAHSLNMEVIAEGVEYENQEATLKELDCDYAQGYYYSVPLPPGELKKIFHISKSHP